MKYLFLGAGAIGTYLAGSLAARGEDVAIVEQPAVAAHIAANGLIVHRGGHTRTERNLTLFTSPGEALATRHDVCVFALKSFDTRAAIDSLVATGREVPPVLSFQNGVDNEPLIGARIGADRVIAGTVTTAIAKPGLGEVIEETHRGIGIAVGHELSERLVASIDNAGLRARAYPQAGPMKWSKLLTNLTGNATSAILDLPVADLFADRRLYEVEVAVLRECLGVMDALGYAPVDLPGTPVRALALATRLPRFVAQPVLGKALGAGRGNKMPSFHIDLHGGRGCTEVRWLNGAVVRHGEAHGVPTPVNRILTETLEDLSAGRQSVEAYRHNPDALLRLLP
ncbi:MAG TPA: 2-dehydropantoate 2-reductase [Propionibacteriaceae bacterium]|nr:2-dehydropantoate 2-reductase [Propionibacteriaceae bacterium]HBY22150.1 2-dehydropantoate 2-reductase [Propionibacteriaceae bacterium]